MAIGRTFQESMQKALRALETGLSGFDDMDLPGVDEAVDETARNGRRAALAIRARTGCW